MELFDFYSPDYMGVAALSTSGSQFHSLTGKGIANTCCNVHLFCDSCGKVLVKYILPFLLPRKYPSDATQVNVI